MIRNEISAQLAMSIANQRDNLIREAAANALGVGFNFPDNLLASFLELHIYPNGDESVMYKGKEILRFIGPIIVGSESVNGSITVRASQNYIKP